MLGISWTNIKGMFGKATKRKNRMATELDSRIWYTDSNTNPVNFFFELMDCISQEAFCTQKWQNFTIYAKNPGNDIIEIDKITSKQILMSSIKDINIIDEIKMSIYVPIKCWRFIGTKAEAAYMMMNVSVWGKDFGKKVGLDLATEGNAQISLLNVGPYCALIENDNKAIQEINELVEQNLEKYLNFLLKLVSIIQAKKILTFTDTGKYNILNSHVAYYQNIEQIAQDIISLKQNFLSSKKNSRFTYHSWRDSVQQIQLDHKMQDSLLKMPDLIDHNIIKKVLQQGQYDYFENEQSLLILNLPFYINAFLADFYLAIIEQHTILA